jgi:hypothetical protein
VERGSTFFLAQYRTERETNPRSVGDSVRQLREDVNVPSVQDPYLDERREVCVFVLREKMPGRFIEQPGGRRSSDAGDSTGVGFLMIQPKRRRARELRGP